MKRPAPGQVAVEPQGDLDQHLVLFKSACGLAGDLDVRLRSDGNQELRKVVNQNVRVTRD